MDLVFLKELWMEILFFLKSNLIKENIIYQLIFILIGIVITYLLNKKMKKLIVYFSRKIKFIKKENSDKIKSLSFLIIFTFLLWLYLFIALALKNSADLIYILSNLLSAWIFIQLIFAFFGDKIIARVLAVFIGIIFSLKISGIYENVIKLLSNISLKSGNINISLLLIIKGSIFLSVSIWIARKLSTYVLDFLGDLSGLNPSLKALLSKITKFIIFTMAILFTLSAVGIDLSSLAFMGGAIAVGLGFGLQKIVSNFVSGIIILIDKSIKPGDVIETGNVYGWIKSLGTRYISVITREGKEYLIPNENLITNEVVNWSYSDNLVMVKTEVDISYDSNIKKAISLVEENIKGLDRIKSHPQSKCFIKEFGESSINLQIRFWIDNPRKGVTNIKHEVHMKVWKIFEENNITIPYPQQDLHVKSMPEASSFESKEEDSEE